MRILVDLDSTIANTLPHWLYAIGQKTGVYAKISDITEWDMHNCYPLNTIPVNEVYDRLQDVGFAKSIVPMAFAPFILSVLHRDGHEIQVVTARNGAISVAETFEWFKEHLGFLPKDRLNFVANKHIIKGDILIDDRAETLIKYKEEWPEAKLIHIKYPYNTKVNNISNGVEYGIRAWVNIKRLILDHDSIP